MATAYCPTCGNSHECDAARVEDSAVRIAEIEARRDIRIAELGAAEARTEAEAAVDVAEAVTEAEAVAAEAHAEGVVEGVEAVAAAVTPDPPEADPGAEPVVVEPPEAEPAAPEPPESSGHRAEPKSSGWVW
jgi:hypothetical protein